MRTPRIIQLRQGGVSLYDQTKRPKPRPRPRPISNRTIAPGFPVFLAPGMPGHSTPPKGSPCQPESNPNFLGRVHREDGSDQYTGYQWTGSSYVVAAKEATASLAMGKLKKMN